VHPGNGYAACARHGQSEVDPLYRGVAAGDGARVCTAAASGRMAGHAHVKTGIAAAVAWLAGNLIGDAAPLFAVFVAVNGMQPTLAASVRAIGAPRSALSSARCPRPRVRAS
jgi:hypothetical protein